MSYFVEVISQIIAVAITIWCVQKLGYAGYKSMMQKRKNDIEGNIASAQTQREQAEQLKNEANEELESIRTKKQKVLDDAAGEAKKEGNDIIAKSKDQAQAIISKAHNEIDLERKQLEEQLSNDVLDLVRLASGRFIEDNLSDEEEERLILEAIELVNNEN